MENTPTTYDDLMVTAVTAVLKLGILLEAAQAEDAGREAGAIVKAVQQVQHACLAALGEA